MPGTADPLEEPDVRQRQPCCLLSSTEDEAKERALQMLRSMLPDDLRLGLDRKGILQFTGKRGVYLMSPYSQTEIHEPRSRRLVGYACLQLSIAAPVYDRIIAEYLLVKNDEELYWKTANIFGGSYWPWPETLVAMIDVGLFLHLLTYFV